ncbi:MAG TPA: hypothetical protein PKY81_15790 [bacterium]|nr:hypothetical protein [bacterium]HPN32414.1 hypothetical protein [bacterium]
MNKKGFIFFFKSKISVVVFSNKSFEKKDFEFSDFSNRSETLLKLLKKTLFTVVLSGDYYYNLKTEIKISDVDSLNKILPNIISNFHFEKNNLFEFEPAIYNIDVLKNSVLCSYISKEKLNQIQGVLTGVKISAINITTMHYFLAEHIKQNKIVSNEKNEYNFYFKTDGLLYVIKLDETDKIESISNSKIREKDLPAIKTLSDPLNSNDNFQFESANIIFKNLNENYKFASFIKKNNFEFADFINFQKEINKTTILLCVIILILYAVYSFAIYSRQKNIYASAKKNQLEIFRKNFPDEKLVIDPLNQTKNLLIKKRNQLNELYKNTPIAADYNIHLNAAFDVLNKYSVRLKQFSLKNNTVTLTGEAESISDIDKIHSELKEKLKGAESVKIINSKYKNILTNTGAEFEISIILKAAAL